MQRRRGLFHLWYKLHKTAPVGIHVRSVLERETMSNLEILPITCATSRECTLAYSGQLHDRNNQNHHTSQQSLSPMPDQYHNRDQLDK
jgi:hypothetical protein